MGANLTDKNITHRKLYYNNQAIIIPAYIKNIMLITNIINRWKIHFNFRQIFPISLFCDIIPAL